MNGHSATPLPAVAPHQAARLLIYNPCTKLHGPVPFLPTLDTQGSNLKKLIQVANRNQDTHETDNGFSNNWTWHSLVVGMGISQIGRAHV